MNLIQCIPDIKGELLIKQFRHFIPLLLFFGVIRFFSALSVYKKLPPHLRDGRKNPRCHPDSPLAGALSRRMLPRPRPDNGGRVRLGLRVPFQPAALEGFSAAPPRPASTVPDSLRSSKRPTRFHHGLNGNYNWKFPFHEKTRLSGRFSPTAPPPPEPAVSIGSLSSFSEGIKSARTVGVRALDPILYGLNPLRG
jgi:hypothetical protein